ncbi:unnamed protein product, partial [Coregonus sp. 'balchen']
CAHGWFGADCAQPCACLNGGVCDRHSGECSCGPGWVGQHCQTACEAGLFGPGCEEQCRSCLPGSYGKDCVLRCNCPHGTSCNHVSGECGCPPGFTGNGCEQICQPGTYGLNCNQVCQCSGTNQLCHPDTGLCYCAPGYHECDIGRYGPNCERLCQCRNAGVCQTTTGTCQCLSGYIGADCNISECQRVPGAWAYPQATVCYLPTCPSGRYGQDCARVAFCGEGARSDPETGRCVCKAGQRGEDCGQGCAQGWYGEDCGQRCNCRNGECPLGSYGANCKLRCDCHNNGTCGRVTGECRCDPGYYGHLCEHACPAGFHGHRCQLQCKCRGHAPCDPSTGHCLCPPGYHGYRCEKGEKQFN